MLERFDQLILDLLPNGAAWDKSKDSNLAAKCEQLGQVFYIVDLLLDLFVNQLSPEKCTNDQLIKFQKNLGLPTDISAQGRAKAVQAYLSTGNIAVKDLIGELQKETGRKIELTEYNPSLCGRARCGQILRGQSYLHVYSLSGFELTDNTRAILRRYKQAHRAVYYIRPDKTVERI